VGGGAAGGSGGGRSGRVRRLLALGGHFAPRTSCSPCCARLPGGAAAAHPLRRPTVAGLAAGGPRRSWRARGVRPAAASLAPIVPIVRRLCRAGTARPPRRSPLRRSGSGPLPALAPSGTFYNTASARRLIGRLDPAALAARRAEVVGAATRPCAPSSESREDTGPGVQSIQPRRRPSAVRHLAACPVRHGRAEARRLARPSRPRRRPFDPPLGARPRARRSFPPPVPAEPGDTEEQPAAPRPPSHRRGRLSVGVLLRELSLLYTACAGRRPSAASRAADPYADYAIWRGSF